MVYVFAWSIFIHPPFADPEGPSLHAFLVLVQSAFDDDAVVMSRSARW